MTSVTPISDQCDILDTQPNVLDGHSHSPSEDGMDTTDEKECDRNPCMNVSHAHYDFYCFKCDNCGKVYDGCSQCDCDRN